MSNGFCKHYPAGGFGQNTHCAAGIELRSMLHREPWGMPCFEGDNHIGECAQAVYDTPEEKAEYERQIAETVARINSAREAIVAHTGGKSWISGEIPCPCCEGGKLRFSVSGYNGHIHAACSTEGCARWLE